MDNSDYEYLEKQNARLWEALCRMRKRYEKLKKQKYLTKIDKEKLYKVI